MDVFDAIKKYYNSYVGYSEFPVTKTIIFLFLNEKDILRIKYKLRAYFGLNEFVHLYVASNLNVFVDMKKNCERWEQRAIRKEEELEALKMLAKSLASNPISSSSTDTVYTIYPTTSTSSQLLITSITNDIQYDNERI
jgi:hypothetical protein